MKDNPLANYAGTPLMNPDEAPFMRKGTIGDWKNYFSAEQSAYVDEMSDRYFKLEKLFLKEN